MEKYEMLATETAIAPPEELKMPCRQHIRIIGKKFTILILRNMIYSSKSTLTNF